MAISSNTHNILYEFVRKAVLHLSDELKNLPLEYEYNTKLVRGFDGHFRKHNERIFNIRRILGDEWLTNLSEYQTCVESLKSNLIIGKHLDRLVGTQVACFRLEVTQILNSFIYSMQDEQGKPTFSDEIFQRKWGEWVAFFVTEYITFKVVAPLPGLAVPTFPLRLNEEIVIDQLTDDEVTRCYQVGVIQDKSLNYPLIYKNIAVGIRKTISLPKLIIQDYELYERPVDEGEGNFGNRPLFRSDLIIDDILSVLRLFKHSRVHSTGFISWNDSFLLSSGTSYQVLSQPPYFGSYCLNENELSPFLDLWHLLKKKSKNLDFSIHRFNLAFDRRTLNDRIVDLVIAAESLLLNGINDRELSYRFVLRAAKFIKHPSYSEYEVFHIMKNAYNARSAIVHGSSPKSREIGLPDNLTTDLTTFTDTIEEIVRLGLCKALSMREESKKLCKPEYWDGLILSKLKPEQ